MRLTFIKKMLAAFLIVFAFSAGLFAFQLNQFLTQPIAESEQVQTINILPGSSAHKVAQQLNQAGLLTFPKRFVWYLRYQEKHGLIKAGELTINPKWTVAQLTDALLKGETVQYPITLIAGHTFKQTLETLKSAEKLKHALSDELTPEALASLYETFGLQNLNDKKYPYAGLEGWFLPETFYYQAGDSDVSILKRAQAHLKTVLETEWQNRAKNLPLKTPYEALILASIVEKETGIAHERPLIAGVFVNRLNKRMRLQTDPTVIYGIGADYDGNIRKRDLLTKTTYNTYKINGLPPTPIAMPSAEAIRAVMHPTPTKALYFVAKGGGEHQFSNTLIEHNKAVQQYLLNR